MKYSRSFETDPDSLLCEKKLVADENPFILRVFPPTSVGLCRRILCCIRGGHPGIKNVQKFLKFDLDKVVPFSLNVRLPFIKFLNQEKHERWIPRFNCQEYAV